MISIIQLLLDLFKKDYLSKVTFFPDFFSRSEKFNIRIISYKNEFLLQFRGLNP